MSRIKKIYVAGALTHSPEPKNIFKEIGKICESLDFDVYVPHLWGTDPVKNPKVSPKEVWFINQRQLSSSSLMIAYVGQPSLGTGQELEIARIANVNIILWWFKGEIVSRMARGNPAVIEKIEAQNEKDLYNKLTDILKNYEK